MNRESLTKLLARHIPRPGCNNDYFFGVECGCEEWLNNEQAWARHVANAIYPE